MNHLPIILITPFTIDPVSKEDLPLQAVKTVYIDALFEARAASCVVPLKTSEEGLKKFADFANGLLIPGGCDINPSLYGEVAIEGSGGPFCHQRDVLELLLIHLFIQRKKPILGICRGMQMINVSQGGTLYQDIKKEIPSGLCHRDPKRSVLEQYFEDAHMAHLQEGTVLSAFFKEQKIPVNSLHHQSVKNLGAGLRVNALAEDGIIEGIESEDMNDQWLLGVQWHPETLREKHHEQNELFKKFVNETRKQEKD